MNGLLRFLETSYTAYHAVENAKTFLTEHGFVPLREQDEWRLVRGGKYFVERNGSALIAFTVGAPGGLRIVAAHTDSPCLKLKDDPLQTTAPFRKLNTEPYGGGIYYTFFDRPLKLAGRVVREKEGKLVPEIFTSDFSLVIPSLAVHMQRNVNESFSPNAQTDLAPMYSLETDDLLTALGDPVSFDLFAVCAEKPFLSGKNNEFVSSPRVDDLIGVYSALSALVSSATDTGICVAACFDNEEIGSRTRQGAGGDFLRNAVCRITGALGLDLARTATSSFLISLDGAHSLHPNHPELCDPTNRAALGGGIVLKSHAGGAYTTDALSGAVLKKIFCSAGVRYQTFYNRSDMRSGGTLGAISLGQISILSADIGIPQLSMHSAVETFAAADYDELLKGLNAFYARTVKTDGDAIEIV